jgi:hypothetical protein
LNENKSKYSTLISRTAKMVIHIFIFRKKGETIFQETEAEMNEDYIIVRGLIPGEMYEFSVVAVDGEHMTESEVEEVEISSMGE